MLKFAQNRLEIPLCDKDATLPRRSLHIGSQVQTRGVSALCEVDRGMIQQAGGNGCTRLQRASASSGVAAPQGCGAYSLVTAWSFCATVGLANNRNFQSRLLDVPTSIAKPSVFCYNIFKLIISNSRTRFAFSIFESGVKHLLLYLIKQIL